VPEAAEPIFGRASLVAMTEWELCYSVDKGGFWLTVDPADIISPAQTRGRPADYEIDRAEGTRGPAVILHREYNWRGPDGKWRRWCVGFGHGREAVARAQRAGSLSLDVKILGCAFWPVGQRPDDRALIPGGSDRFSCPDFDQEKAGWLELPQDACQEQSAV